MSGKFIATLIIYIAPQQAGELVMGESIMSINTVEGLTHE